MLKPAKLALEDGTVFTGTSFGADGEVDGEVCFNTSMTGYQEILTDPSYRGQIVTMTYPEIGNYGANGEDPESARPYIEGLVVREFSSVASNWRSQQHAEAYLAEANIPVAAEIDTRKLVRHLRTRGVMRGVLSGAGGDPQALVEKMLDMAQVTKDSVVYDIGCGDGRIVLYAAKAFGAHGVGIDIDPARISESKENAKKEGVEKLVKFLMEDATKTDISPATIVTTGVSAVNSVRMRAVAASRLA